METVQDLLTREAAPRPAKARPKPKRAKVAPEKGSLRDTVSGSDDPLPSLKASGAVKTVDELTG